MTSDDAMKKIKSLKKELKRTQEIRDALRRREEQLHETLEFARTSLNNYCDECPFQKACDAGEKCVVHHAGDMRSYHPKSKCKLYELRQRFML